MTQREGDGRPCLATARRCRQPEQPWGPFRRVKAGLVDFVSGSDNRIVLAA
jgi:hypothetical protein